MDPIANMFSLMNQTLLKRKKTLVLPFSKIKWEILVVLYLEGYLSGCVRKKIYPKKWSKKPLEYIVVSPKLAYTVSASAQKALLSRVSTPGCRVYLSSNNLAKRSLGEMQKGLGTVLLSTVHGVLVGRDAKALKVGGELICSIF